jgi:ArsR family transcriptional regulator
MASDLARILKAAAEPTRLRLLNLLRSGDICVCDLQTILDLPQHAVSRHLAVLRHAGLVTDRRHGQRVLYSLADPASLPAKALWQLVADCCLVDETLRDDEHHLRQTLERGECLLTSQSKGE